MSYDGKCADLALHFLSDYKLSDTDRVKRADRLARLIQGAVENYLEGAELEPQSPQGERNTK